MRRVIPYILLFALFYGAWYYWQQRPKPPLKADLLPYSVADIERLVLSSEHGGTFELSKSADSWIVENEHKSINDNHQKGVLLVNSLLAIRSSRIANQEQVGDELMTINLKGRNIQDRLVLYAANDSLANIACLVRLNDVGDYYAVENFNWQELPMHFNDYRSFRLIDLEHHSQLDSLVWWDAIDSTRSIIMQRYSADSSRLDSLQQAWSPKEESYFADFFGETLHANHLLGYYLLYGSGDSIPDRLNIYNNNNWDRPYVIKGSDSEYFVLDSLNAYRF